MLFICIFLWTMSAMLFFSNPKNKVNVWCSLVAFFSGCAGLGTYIEESVIPMLTGQLKYWITILDSFIFTLSHQFSPYSFLVYAVHYSNSFKKRSDRINKNFSMVLAIPALIGYFAQQIVPYFKPNYVYLCVWVVPYIFCGNYLIFKEYLKETNLRIKQQKLLVCILFCPITLLTAFLNYIFGLIDIKDAWRFQVFTVGTVFFLFIIYAVKFGALGVKLKIEKYRLDNAFKAFSSGTAQLNHSIKNGILKITMCIDNIKSSVKKANELEPLKKSLNEDIHIISISADHLIEMVKRFQEQMQDIVISPTQNSIMDIVNQALTMVKPLVLSKNVTVKKDMEFDAILKCDEFHLKEALINILKNSIDAMEPNGTIIIDFSRTQNRGIAISITDNGKGIPEDTINRVFDPFFSTKKSDLNFGLGLFYCYNVMLYHGGKCDISSRVGEGTSVLLTFNKKSVFEVVEV